MKVHVACSIPDQQTLAMILPDPEGGKATIVDESDANAKNAKAAGGKPREAMVIMLIKAKVLLDGQNPDK